MITFTRRKEEVKTHVYKKETFRVRVELVHTGNQHAYINCCYYDGEKIKQYHEMRLIETFPYLLLIFVTCSTLIDNTH